MPAPESAPDPRSAASERGADWEAFYRDYRKPGYVPGFEITSKLGGGMFGLVFRARKQSIGKDYAIKFLQVDDTEVRRAVLAELEQVKYFAQIDHPNLVSIEDRGEVDGIPYLVMSFAGTETLRDRIPTTGAPPTAEQREELVRYFLQACRGLSALHERSLVHFDIKPANVFLKGSVARLGDYGLSKLVTHSRGSLSMGRGTPYYMAPEMLQRRGDARSDIYSLGVMLYEILCGKVPFTGDSEWEVLRAHETKAPELPPHLTALERAVLQRCLQKDPAARFPSVHDLIATFGSPASVGAAVWSDVRAGVSPPPSTTPPPPPKPAGPAEDHLAGLGKASRDVARHAKHMAEEAVGKARQVVEKALQEVNRQGKVIVGRDRGGRAMRWAQEWQQRRRERQRRAAERRAERAAQRAQRRGGAFRAFVTTLGFFVLVGVFAALFLVPMGVDVGPRQVAIGMTMPESGIGYFDARFVPREYTDAVTMTEPAWVRRFASDRSAAREELLARIEQLRAVAPLTEEQQAAAGSLPSFRATPRLDPSVQQAKNSLEAYLRAPDRQLGQLAEYTLRTYGGLAVVVGATMLAETPWRKSTDVVRAKRLHRFLADASGCRDIEWVDAPSREPEDYGQHNRHLGSLWMWFANEFAFNARTWETYRALMVKR